MEILWITDLHLDRFNASYLRTFYRDVDSHPSGTIVLTGDISDGNSVKYHLEELALSCPKKRIFFTLGNHDYFRSSFARVDAEVVAVCARHQNLTQLTGQEIIPLDQNTCVLGHRGWADAQAGFGNQSWARNADFWLIDDLRGNRERAFQRIKELGQESASCFRKILPLALTQYNHVVICTHVPPFRQVVRHEGGDCSPLRLPHFVNIAAGNAIAGITREFPNRKVTVLSGHTHHEAEAQVFKNLQVIVGIPRNLKSVKFTN